MDRGGLGIVRAGSSSACATAFPPSANVDVVRDFIAARLPLSGHLGGLLELGLECDRRPDGK